MKTRLHSFGPVLAGFPLLLLAIGLFCLVTIGPDADPFRYFRRQVFFAVPGIAGMLALSTVHFARIEKCAYALYLGAVLVLLALLVAARPVRGVRAWFVVGGFTVQPSEFVKIVLVLALARFVSRVREWRLRDLALLLGLAGVPIALVVLQPDLGMSLVMAFGTVAVMVAGRVPWKILFGLAGILLVLSPVVFLFGLREYQRQRIIALVDPEKAEAGKRDQQDQAMRLFASGGLAGRGLGEATQAQPYYLPERHNDFVFSVIGEEMGFVGSLLTLLLFGGILWAGLRCAVRHRDPFPRIAMTGLCAILYLQVFSHLGMTMGLLPVTGLTLPFVSYGGSSLWSSFAAVGVMLSIARHWKPAFSSHELPENSYALDLPGIR